MQSVLRAPALDTELDDPSLHAAPGRRHRIGAIRRPYHDQVTDSLRIPLRKGERDHSPVRPSGDRPERLQAQVVEEPQQDFGLIVAGDGGKRLTGRRPGRVGAATEVIEAQDAMPRGIHRPVRPHDLRPPAVTRIIGEADTPMCRDSTQGAHDGRIRSADEPPGYAHPRELPAVVKRDFTGDFKNSLARYDATDGLAGGIADRGAPGLCPRGRKGFD